MPLDDLDRKHEWMDAEPADQRCPKCGVAMEPIEASEAAPRLEHLQLCPSCYLVMWRDEDGLHVGQGMPVTKRPNPAEPEQC